MQLNLTLEEAKSVLHALVRTNARNTILEGCIKGVLDNTEHVEDLLQELINKPVETTNEQPISNDERDKILDTNRF